MSIPSTENPVEMMQPERGFADAEFAARVTRAQSTMYEEELDAILVTSPANFRYFSGFDSQFWESPTRPWYLVIPAKGEPIAVIPEIAEPEVLATWLVNVISWPAPRPNDDGLSELAQVFSKIPPRFARIGAELGREMSLRMPVTDFNKLRALASRFELVDGSAAIWRTRMTKSPTEISHIRYVCQVVSESYEALASRLEVGMTEREINRLLRIDLAIRGLDSTPFLPVISGEGGVPQIVCGPSDRPIGDGDILFVDTGSTFDGYFCDFDRVYAVGEVGDDAKEAHDLVWRATEAGIRAARPGATAEDLWKAMQSVLDASGTVQSNVGRSGHGLGMQLTEPPSNMPGDLTVLEENMVITIEPGLEYAPGKMIVHEENVVITCDGAELLTRRAPQDMWTVV